MSSVNKVILIGRLGNNPEVKIIGENNTCTRMSIATSEKWQKDGETQEKTEWHRVVAWGKLGEICGKHLEKGSQVYIEGKLQTTSYEKDGVKKYSTDIVATSMQFVSKKKEESEEEVAF